MTRRAPRSRCCPEQHRAVIARDRLEHQPRGVLAETHPRYQDAIRMADLDGLTQVEAARRAGVSVSEMKSRVQRPRQHSARSWRNAAAGISIAGDP